MLNDSQKATQEDGPAGADRTGNAVIAFFGRRSTSRRVSLTPKSNLRAEVWGMLALLLFACLIAYAIWASVFGSH